MTTPDLFPTARHSAREARNAADLLHLQADVHDINGRTHLASQLRRQADRLEASAIAPRAAKRLPLCERRK